MHKDVARNGDATPRWYLPDSRVVEFACRRDYSAIFRITPEVLKRRRMLMKSFAVRETARRENYTRGVSVCRCALVRKSFVRTNHRISRFLIYVHGLLVNSY